MLHLLKMCVGCESIDDLAQFQADRRLRGEPNIHRTRNFPKRGAEILSGGSLYWIIKGQIRVRQRVLALDAIEVPEGGRFCVIGLDAKLVPVAPQPYRPMQGWRYLEASDAPPDADPNRPDQSHEMPPAMIRELRSLGLL